MPNRVTDAIARMDRKVAELPDDKRDSLRKNLETDFADLCHYQDLQARAHAMGRITTEEALTLYRAFGGEAPSPEHWSRNSLATQIIATQLIGELLG